MRAPLGGKGAFLGRLGVSSFAPLTGKPKSADKAAYVRRAAERLDWPVRPLHLVQAWDVENSVANGVRNAYADQLIAPPTSNAFGLPRSPRNQGSGPTVTPSVDGTTFSRVVYGTTTQLFSLYTASSPTPANDGAKKSFRIYARSRAGAGTQAARWGNSAAYSSGNITEAGGYLTYEWTANYTSIVLLGDGTNLLDVELDKAQFHNGPLGQMPDFEAGQAGDDAVFPLGWNGISRFSNHCLKNTDSDVQGAMILRLKGYPAAKTFTEITVMAALHMDTAAANSIAWSTDTDTVLGTTQSTVNIIGGATGEFAFSGLTKLAKHILTGQGVQIHAFRLNPTTREAFWNGVPLSLTSSAFAGFQAAVFRLLAAGSSMTTFQNTFWLRGGCAAAALWDRYLDDAQVAQAASVMRAQCVANGVTMPTLPYFLTSCGDSQTASFTGARGPSWAVLQADAGRYTPNMPIRNLAVGGKTLADIINEQLPEVRRVQKGVNAIAGCKHAVPFWACSNNRDDIVASPSGYFSTMVSTFIRPVLDMGAIPVIATPPADNDVSTPGGYDAARLQFRDIVIASGYHYMDFGGTAGFSTIADTAGANFDTDHRHVTTAGHLLLAPVAAAAIAAAVA